MICDVHANAADVNGMKQYHFQWMTSRVIFSSSMNMLPRMIIKFCVANNTHTSLGDVVDLQYIEDVFN